MPLCLLGLHRRAGADLTMHRTIISSTALFSPTLSFSELCDLCGSTRTLSATTKLARRGNQDDAILHAHIVARHILTRRPAQHPPVAHVEARQMHRAGQHAAVQLAIRER